MKDEAGAGGGGGETNAWARVCDTCRAAACTVYCRADSAYLCAGCDARIHAANRVASRHERVWVCEACERAPAAFICKADAASLCTTCDADIHSANPLARRHHRVPVLPISGCLYGPPATDRVGSTALLAQTEDGFLSADGDEAFDQDQDEDTDETSSWLLLNPVKNGQSQGNGGFLFGGEVDEYLDLVEYNSGAENNNQFGEFNQNNQVQQGHQSYGVSHQKSYGGDSVVPVQCGSEKSQLQQQHQNPSFHLGLEYESSKTGYSYNGSISHSVSLLFGFKDLLCIIMV